MQIEFEIPLPTPFVAGDIMNETEDRIKAVLDILTREIAVKPYSCKELINLFKAAGLRIIPESLIKEYGIDERYLKLIGRSES